MIPQGAAPPGEFVLVKIDGAITYDVLKCVPRRRYFSRGGARSEVKRSATHETWPTLRFAECRCYCRMTSGRYTQWSNTMVEGSMMMVRVFVAEPYAFVAVTVMLLVPVVNQVKLNVSLVPRPV